MTSKVSVICQKQNLFLSAPKFAVVGASANPAENGYKVLKFLLEKSKDVVPINPSASEIQGINCLKTLSELPDPTHTSVFIVAPPNVTLEVLKLAKALNIFALSLQPGAEDDAVVKFIQADLQLEGRCLYREDRKDGLYRGTIPPEHALARFALVPELTPTGDIICGIFQRCESVTQNRNAAFQLRDRCNRLGLVLYNRAVANENISTVIEPVNLSLREISAKMDGWLQLNAVQGFLHQGEIAKDIEHCHRILTDCWGSVQTETDDWEPQFKLETEKDHRELVAYLVDVGKSQQITDDALKAQSADIRQMMSMMQDMMGNNLRTSNQHDGLSSNLYDLQFKTHELLPDFNLRSGEVIRIGQFPVFGTSAMDIYEGLYLGREKVAIKVVRTINANEHSLRRFNRECDIWKKLWKIDQGQHVLPFYGFCQEDGPFPYMVSPWQENGTVLTYVKREGDKVDYLKLVKGVALGLQVLHSIDPHIVHGDIKASNIVVDKGGHPLIADFGLSRIVEDITGIPFSQSRGVSDSYRWFAPEVCIGQGVLSLSSDVYAYGMTVLEIFTHEKPYNNIKHTTEAVIRAGKGERPPRPTANKVIRRGLDDDMWALLCLCWTMEPSERPTIHQVLNTLSPVSASILDHTGATLGGTSGDGKIDSRNPTSGSKTTGDAGAALQGYLEALQRYSSDIKSLVYQARQSIQISATNHTVSTLVHEHMKLNISAVVEGLVLFLRNQDSYKDFLSRRGAHAQQLLDILQDLVDLDSLSEIKPFVFQALLQLSRPGLHPRCMTLSGLQKIGQQAVAGGAFGDIWKGLVQEQSVCVKIMRLFEDSNVDAVLKEFGREAIIWRQLWHPNVLPFFGVYYLDSRLCLVSPWMENGNIIKFLAAKKPNNAERLPLILDVALGLQYLHEQKVVHGDLKGANILVTPSQRACIADFGLSTIAEAMTVRSTHTTATARGGTPRYQAPELIQIGSNHYGSDVYAFACVCYEIVADKPPFHEIRSNIAIAMGVLQGQRPPRPEWWAGTRELDGLWELMQKCWEMDNEMRPMASEIVEQLVGPSIGTKATSAPTEDWDPEFTSKFRRSQQARPLLPTVTQIERILFGDEAAEACRECFPHEKTRETGTFVIYSPNGQEPKAAADSFTTNDLAWTQSNLDTGGCLASVHEPAEAMLWIEDHWDDDLLTSVQNSGCDGPFACMLSPDEPALAIFGDYNDPKVVNMAQSLAETSGFPVVIRPACDNSILTLLTRDPGPPNVSVSIGTAGNSAEGGSDGNNEDETMPEGSHIPGESGNGRRSDDNPNDAESNGEAVRIAENRTGSPGATHGINGSGGGGGDDSGGPSVVDDKWDSPLHRTHLDLGLKLDNGETYAIGIDYTFRFTINSQTVPPIDLEDLTRPLSKSEVIALVDLEIETRPRETQVDRSYASIGFVAHRKKSIIHREFFPRGSDPPGKLYQRGEQRQIQRGITGVLGLVNTGPTATTTFSYNQNNTTTLGATDSKVMPKCLVDSEIGDKWDADNESYSSFNIAYPAQYIRLNEEQPNYPLEVKVGMGINLNPAGSEKPLPRISFVNRHQILVWVSDPMSRTPIRGIVVLISSYLDNIRTEEGLSIHEREDVRLGTGSLPQTKKEEHEPGTISLSVAQVRKPGVTGSDNLRPRITAFFTKLAQRSVVPSMEYIPRHEYLARGWDGNSNKWRSVLWPALDVDFRAADPEETSAIWRIKCPWKEARVPIRTNVQPTRETGLTAC